MNRQTDWCESHECLRLSCIQRGLHRVGEPEEPTETGALDACEMCEFAVDSMSIDELRAKLRSYLLDHVRENDDANIKLRAENARLTAELVDADRRWEDAFLNAEGKVVEQEKRAKAAEADNVRLREALEAADLYPNEPATHRMVRDALKAKP